MEPSIRWKSPVDSSRPVRTPSGAPSVRLLMPIAHRVGAGAVFASWAALLVLMLVLVLDSTASAGDGAGPWRASHGELELHPSMRRASTSTQQAHTRQRASPPTFFLWQQQSGDAGRQRTATRLVSPTLSRLALWLSRSHHPIRSQPCCSWVCCLAHAHTYSCAAFLAPSPTTLRSRVCPCPRSSRTILRPLTPTASIVTRAGLLELP